LPENHNCIGLPERNWSIFRGLKNSREAYGWSKPKQKGTPHSVRKKADPELYEPNSPLEEEKPLKKQKKTGYMRCYKCGSEDSLYPCIYCNELFCDKHILPENHNCPNYLPPKKVETLVKIPKIGNRINKITYRIKRIKLKPKFYTMVNLIFLFLISLPVLDSIQLMWDSPITFSRTVLPKWWAIFPSEYPIPSVNLLYLYFGALILYIYSAWLFLSNMVHRNFYYKKFRHIHYYYVIIMGIIFLYFFSEANMFWLNNVEKIILPIIRRINV